MLVNIYAAIVRHDSANKAKEHLCQFLIDAESVPHAEREFWRIMDDVQANIEIFRAEPFTTKNEG